MNVRFSLMMRFVAATAMVFAAMIATPAAEISGDGKKLQDFLDRTGVEHLWPAGEHVNWETGVPDGKPEKSAGKHTHCSAFVASMAKQLGVYILRPPEHGQILLANAQYDWLGDAGDAQGWREVGDAHRAQSEANRGMLVVATYKNRHDDKPGHIVIVRPGNKSSAAIDAEGPDITQAGGTNFVSTSLRRGFAGHPQAWPRNEVRYYEHAVDWRRVR
jgi:hypothetical protein